MSKESSAEKYINGSPQTQRLLQTKAIKQDFPYSAQVFSWSDGSVVWRHVGNGRFYSTTSVERGKALNRESIAYPAHEGPVSRSILEQIEVPSSVATIAMKTGLSEQIVRDVLKSMKAYGFFIECVADTWKRTLPF